MWLATSGALAAVPVKDGHYHFVRTLGRDRSTSKVDLELTVANDGRELAYPSGMSERLACGRDDTLTDGIAFDGAVDAPFAPCRSGPPGASRPTPLPDRHAPVPLERTLHAARCAHCTSEAHPGGAAELVHFQPCAAPKSSNDADIIMWAVNLDCATASTFPVDGLLGDPESATGPCSAINDLSYKASACAPLAGYACRARSVEYEGVFGFYAVCIRQHLSRARLLLRDLTHAWPPMRAASGA